MLDIKLIRDNPDIVKADLDKRGEGEKLGLLDELVVNDRQWRQALEKVNELKHERNKLSKEISEAKRAGGDADDLIARSSEIPKEINGLDEAGNALDPDDVSKREWPFGNQEEPADEIGRGRLGCEPEGYGQDSRRAEEHAELKAHLVQSGREHERR